MRTIETSFGFDSTGAKGWERGPQDKSATFQWNVTLHQCLDGIEIPKDILEIYQEDLDFHSILLRKTHHSLHFKALTKDAFEDPAEMRALLGLPPLPS